MLRSARFAAAYASDGDPSTTGRSTPPDGDVPAAGDTMPRTRIPRTILLVEDDPVVRHVVRLLLELEGDVVLEAKDGDDALGILGGYHGTLDLLLTDVMMPGLSGAEVCDRVRAGRPGLPTLFISGFYPEAVFPDQRLPEGAAFLAKPFMPEELIEAVDELLATVSGDGAARPPRAPRARRARF
jgi:two-component system, cell cycle sensor histidine kinase and response regulator CckA